MHWVTQICPLLFLNSLISNPSRPTSNSAAYRTPRRRFSTYSNSSLASSTLSSSQWGVRTQKTVEDAEQTPAKGVQTRFYSLAASFIWNQPLCCQILYHSDPFLKNLNRGRDHIQIKTHQWRSRAEGIGQDLVKSRWLSTLTQRRRTWTGTLEGEECPPEHLFGRRLNGSAEFSRIGTAQLPQCNWLQLSQSDCRGQTLVASFLVMSILNSWVCGWSFRNQLREVVIFFRIISR